MRQTHIPKVKILLRFKHRNHLGSWNEFTLDFMILNDFINYLRWVPAVAKIIVYDNPQSKTARKEDIDRYKDVRIIIWDNGNEIVEFRTSKELFDHLESTPDLKAAL